MKYRFETGHAGGRDDMDRLTTDQRDVLRFALNGSHVEFDGTYYLWRFPIGFCPRVLAPKLSGRTVRSLIWREYLSVVPPAKRQRSHRTTYRATDKAREAVRTDREVG